MTLLKVSVMIAMSIFINIVVTTEKVKKKSQFGIANDYGRFWYPSVLKSAREVR